MISGLKDIKATDYAASFEEKQMNEYQTKCLALSKLYAEAAETGRSIQWRDCNGAWHDGCIAGPNLDKDLGEYRIRPAPVVLTVKTYRHIHTLHFLSWNSLSAHMDVCADLPDHWQLVDTRDIEIAP